MPATTPVLFSPTISVAVFCESLELAGSPVFGCWSLGVGSLWVDASRLAAGCFASCPANCFSSRSFDNCQITTPAIALMTTSAASESQSMPEEFRRASWDATDRRPPALICGTAAPAVRDCGGADAPGSGGGGADC